MNITDSTRQIICENKFYIIAAISAIVTVGVVFSTSEIEDLLNNIGFFESLSISNTQTLSDSSTTSGPISDANLPASIPKFSIEEYLKYSSMESLS